MLKDISFLKKELDEKIEDIEHRIAEATEVSFDQAASEFVNDMDNCNHAKLRPFGINSLNRNIGGMEDGDLVILAARPGMGKTSLAIKIAIENALSGFPTLVVTREMSIQSLFKRIMSMLAKIPSEKLRIKDFSFDDQKQIISNIGKIHGIPLWFTNKDISYLKYPRTIARLVKKYGIKTIVDDYLQLTVDDSKSAGNREQFIAAVTRQHKNICQEYNLATILLSQLSRQCETRTNKRPLLSDLRESGAIEQDADMVIFVYRDEYYGVMQDENGNSTQGVAEVIVAKYRNGSPCQTRVSFEGEYTLFDDLPETRTIEVSTDIALWEKEVGLSPF
jgi:replicative DNA helicase